MAAEALLALWNDTPTRRAIFVSMKEDWSAVFASA